MSTSEMLAILIPVMMGATSFLYKYSKTHKKYRRLFIISLGLTVFLSIVTVFLWVWTVSQKETNDEISEVIKNDEAIENKKDDATENFSEALQEQAPSEQTDEIDNKNIDWAIVAESRTVVVELYLEEPDGEKTVIMSGSGFFVDKDTVITCSYLTEASDSAIQVYNEKYGTQISRNDFKLKVISPYDDFICDASLKVNDVENDIAILSVYNSEERFSSSDLFPKFRSTLPVTGEELSSLGYTYDRERKEAGFYPYKIVCLHGKVLNDVNFNDSKTKTFSLRTALPDDDSIYGTGGGPVIDEDGYVIGIEEASSVDQFDGEQTLWIISTNEILKLLQY